MKNELISNIEKNSGFSPLAQYLNVDISNALMKSYVLKKTFSINDYDRVLCNSKIDNLEFKSE